MNWLGFTLVSVITLSIASLLQRVLMKEEKSDPISYSLVFQFMCAGVCMIFAFIKGFVLPPVTIFSFNFFLEAVLYSGFTVFLFKALKTTPVSQVTVLTSTSAFWSIIAGVIFLGEAFSVMRAIGALLIFGGVLLVFKKNFHASLQKGSLFTLAAAFCLGVALVNDRFLLEYSDTVSYLAISFLFPSILLSIFNPRALTKITEFLNRKKLVYMCLLAFFYSIAALTTYLAFQAGGNASQVAPVAQSRIILTILLAAIFLGEKTELIKKLVAASIVIVGIALLT